MEIRKLTETGIYYEISIIVDYGLINFIHKHDISPFRVLDDKNEWVKILIKNEPKFKHGDLCWVLDNTSNLVAPGVLRVKILHKTYTSFMDTVFETDRLYKEYIRLTPGTIPVIKKEETPVTRMGRPIFSLVRRAETPTPESSDEESDDRVDPSSTNNDRVDDPEDINQSNKTLLVSGLDRGEKDSRASKPDADNNLMIVNRTRTSFVLKNEFYTFVEKHDKALIEEAPGVTPTNSGFTRINHVAHTNKSGTVELRLITLSSEPGDKLFERLKFLLDFYRRSLELEYY